MRTITVVLRRGSIGLLGCLLAAVAGCESTGTRIPLTKQLRILKQENAQLQNQAEQSAAETEQLKKQVQTLSGLPQDKLENLYDIQKIKITRYTGFYDKDDDGSKEELIVYIQPLDEDGDIVKAAGSVDVQLWDLNRENGQALLGQWHVGPEELKKNWFATLITINYRLTFDVSAQIKGLEGPLTVKVTFTDYLSGRVFNEQRVIKPR